MTADSRDLPVIGGSHVTWAGLNGCVEASDIDARVLPFLTGDVVLNDWGNEVELTIVLAVLPGQIVRSPLSEKTTFTIGKATVECTAICELHADKTHWWNW